MQSNKVKVLILGAQGKLGRVVYQRLKHEKRINCIGTAKKKTNKYLKFDVRNLPQSWNRLLDITSPTHVINCIGLLRTYSNNHVPSLREYKNINSSFPKHLEISANSSDFKLIHFSTDAVFTTSAKGVTEHDAPSPSGDYATTKYYGEVTGKNVITIRTSFVGYDPINNNGLIERIKNASDSYSDYTHQAWSGASALQVAELLHWIIVKNGFNKLKRVTSVFHYAPLGPTTMHDLVKNISKIENKKLLIRGNSVPIRISRYLDSEYKSFLPKYLYNNNIPSNLKKLKTFESKIKLDV